MCAVVAVIGRGLSCGSGSWPTCVELIMAAFGILTATPGLAGMRGPRVSVRLTKWPVALSCILPGNYRVITGNYQLPPLHAVTVVITAKYLLVTGISITG